LNIKDNITYFIILSIINTKLIMDKINLALYFTNKNNFKKYMTNIISDISSQNKLTWTQSFIINK